MFTIKPKKNINQIKKDIVSYDMFDTLVFRYCKEPHFVFDSIQTQVNNFNYKIHRINAEQVSYGSIQNANIDDIYNTMKRLYNYDDNTINYYKQTEIKTEINMIYPNNEMFLKLTEKDIIVSDMYLKENHLRTILKKCVQHNKNIYGNTVHHVNIDKIKIYVSSGGKSGGLIWKHVNEQKSILYHIGDNHQSDYQMTKKNGLNAIHYKGTPYNNMEQYLINNNVDLANLCRYIRLLNPYPLKSHDHIIYNAESNINIPVLLLTCKYLNGLNKKLLFNLRDCYYLKTFYDILYPNSHSHYLNSSRNSLNDPSDEYINYMNDIIIDNSLIIDLHGSGKSIFTFIESYIKSNVDVFYITTDQHKRHEKLTYFIKDKARVLIESLNVNYLNSFFTLKNGISYRLKNDFGMSKYNSIYYPIVNAIHKLKTESIQLTFDVEYIDTLYNKNNMFGNSNITGVDHINQFFDCLCDHKTNNLYPLNHTKMTIIAFHTLGKPYDNGLNLSIEGKIFENFFTPHVDNVCVYDTKKCLNFNNNFVNDYLKTYPDLNHGEHARGCNMSFWKWKPYIILHHLEQMNDNEILVYHDCNITRYSYYLNTNTFRENIDYIFEKTGIDIIIPIERPDLLCKHHCKKDVFDAIGNTNDYKNFPLLNANRILIKKTKLSMEFIHEWLFYCNQDLILPEKIKEPELRWHTHDQAILTVLYKKYINDGKLPKKAPFFYLKDKVLSKNTIIFI